MFQEKKVEAIVFVRDEKERKIFIMAEVLSKMIHLKLLILEGVIFTGHFSCLSNELRYIRWDEHPFMYWPSSFQPNKLVELILRRSSVLQLWKDKKVL